MTIPTPSLRVTRALAWVFGIVSLLLVVGVITKAEWLAVVLVMLKGLLGLPT